MRVTTGAPKKLTYARKARIVDGDDGKTYIAELDNVRFRLNHAEQYAVPRRDHPRYRSASCLLGVAVLMTEALAYLRTSSATNVGADKDSDKRQREAIQAFASAAGYTIVGEEYDAAVSGADPVSDRPGFMRLLERIKGNGVRTIIVESPDRFARDLTVQLLGHDMLKREGISLIAASAPTHFLEETPTAVMVRQILGAVAQFEKASLVAKLRAARERKRKAGGKADGQKPMSERNPDAAIWARKLDQPGASLRSIALSLAKMGYAAPSGKPYHVSVIKGMLNRPR